MSDHKDQDLLNDPDLFQDPRAVDGARGHRLQEVHLGLRRVELRHRHVGGECMERGDKRTETFGHVRLHIRDSNAKLPVEVNAE